jgi:hypothetical protein
MLPVADFRNCDRLVWRTGALIYWEGGRWTKYIKINMAKYHFVHHKTHMNWPTIEFEFRDEKPILVFKAADV